MSVSQECMVGKNEVIYFIDNCTEAVIDENGIFDTEKSIEHKIGDKVYFLDWFYEVIEGNQCTMIKYKDKNGRIYSAVESFFVTEDVWEGLKSYFKDFYTYNL